MTIRLLSITATGTFNVPPPPLPTQRAYTVTTNQILDVPGDMTGDAGEIVNSGFTVLGSVGQTSARPIANLRVGDRHVDLTLGFTVIWDGTNWRNPVTGGVV
jgi:hypothetical protein